MYLYIDTTEREYFEVAAFDAHALVIKKRVASKRKSSELLLRSIEAIIKAAKATKDELRGIAVVRGPGSFTALRIGVVTANALAYGLGIPVVGVDKNADFTTLGSWVNKQKGKNRIVLPEYGGDPLIGKRKR